MQTNNLPKDKAQVVAKTMIDLNYSATKIANTLGIGRASVYRYAEQPTPEELRQFETEIKTLVTVKQYELIASILNKLQGTINEAYFKDLVVAYTAFSKNNQDTTQTSDRPDDIERYRIQVARDREKYGI